MGLIDTTPAANIYHALRLKGFQDSAVLRELEQAAIERALEWLMFKHYTADELLSEAFIKFLHKKLFGSIWKTAGKFRQADLGKGCPWSNIAIQLRQLNEEAKDWHQQQTYNPHELAVRYAHRLTVIYCFDQGNGRLSRLMADLIISKLYQAPPFTWGRHLRHTPEALQQAYQAAMEAADCNEYEALIQFSQS